MRHTVSMDNRPLEKAWKLGSEYRSISGELSVSPWDALLMEIRRSAYRVQWIDSHIDEAGRRLEDLETRGNEVPGYEDMDQGDLTMIMNNLSGQVRGWMGESRKERAHLARSSKAAIDAGLAERFTQSIEGEARMIAKVLDTAMAAAELTADQQQRAVTALRGALAEVSNTLFERHNFTPQAISQ